MSTSLELLQLYGVKYIVGGELSENLSFRASIRLSHTSQLREFQFVGSVIYILTNMIRLSSIIVTRFLLNLRQLASIESYDSETSRAANAEAEQGTWLSQIRFNHSFVDNMGEDLEHSIDMQNRDSGMTWLESDNAVAANGEVNVVSSGDEPSVVPDNASGAGASTLHQMTDA